MESKLCKECKCKKHIDEFMKLNRFNNDRSDICDICLRDNGKYRIVRINVKPPIYVIKKLTRT